MSLAISFKRCPQGLQVIKRRQVVAHITRSEPGSPGHEPGLPWTLLHSSGRIDRHDSLAGARDDAQKL